MLLTEMFQDKMGDYQNLDQDQSQYKMTDLRKTRLTLAQINQLRKMNDQRTSEYYSDLGKIRKQYAAPPPQQ